jgi:hypothetical protein
MKEHIKDIIQKKQKRKIQILESVQQQATVENDTFFMDREPKESELAFSHAIKVTQTDQVPSKRPSNPNFESKKQRNSQPFSHQPAREFKKPKVLDEEPEEVKKTSTHIRF